jgi:uncharacterized repeat protein (TIGR03803 family)
MRTTSINRMEPFIATLGKLKWGKRAFAVFVVCAATAMALPAQTFTTLFNFDHTNGAGPVAGMVQATDGNLYGTTPGGGPNRGPFGTGAGTVFKTAANGTLTTLYNFCSQGGCSDGALPFGGLIQAANGDFYGTTQEGGEYGWGTVFRITPIGTLTTPYSFHLTDGAAPYAGLVQARDGDLYGTTLSGGVPDNALAGTIFRITPGGTFTTLYNFCSEAGCTDGENPHAALVQAANGDFYGTTFNGGTNSGGTVFKITPGGTLTTLYRFCAQAFPCPDGGGPIAGLVQAANGDLYGTASGGCGPQCSSDGTIFKITPTGALTTIYSFCSPKRVRGRPSAARGAGPGQQWHALRDNVQWRGRGWRHGLRNHPEWRANDAKQFLLAKRVR